MKTICLIASKIDAFRKALKNKDISLSDLTKISSEKRIELLKEYAGDSAKDVSLLIESKLILKNKILGLRNAVNKLGEMGKYSPTKKAEIEKALIDFKEKQFERMFNPKEEQSYLSNLVEKIFGTEITREEASNIFSLTEKVKEFESKLNVEDLDKKGNYKNPEDAIKYASSKVVLDKYMDILKNPNIKVNDMWKNRMEEFKQTYSENKSKAISDILVDALITINDNTIALVATFDNSYIGRQGLVTLMTHPTVWWKGAINSFIDFAKTLKGKGEQVQDAITASYYSRPNYLNGSYEIAKLIPKTEEQFPTSLPEHLQNIKVKNKTLNITLAPVRLLGRIFKASELSFTGAAIRMRTGLYDLLAESAKSNGIDMTDKIQIQELGKVVNSMTARGDAKWTDSEVVRGVLWAPKMLDGNINVLTAHWFGIKLATPFARKQAYINIAKIAAETVGVAIVINAIRPKTIELNPTSSDFLKQKVNNTRYDALTAGRASILTLVARMFCGLTGLDVKSTNGTYSKLNSGDYGSTTLFDVGLNFLTNKVTPPARTIVDILKGTDANYQKTSVKGELLNKIPISIQNWYGINNDYTAEAIIGSIVDLIGINSNTYAPIESKTKLKSLTPLPKLKPLPKLNNQPSTGLLDFLKGNKQRTSATPFPIKTPYEQLNIKNSLIADYPEMSSRFANDIYNSIIKDISGSQTSSKDKPNLVGPGTYNSLLKNSATASAINKGDNVINTYGSQPTAVLIHEELHTQFTKLNKNNSGDFAKNFDLDYYNYLSKHFNDNSDTIKSMNRIDKTLSDNYNNLRGYDRANERFSYLGEHPELIPKELNKYYKGIFDKPTPKDFLKNI